VPRRSAKAAPTTPVDEVTDRLYSLDPDEFTQARNDEAKRLRVEGDREASDAVKALKRPTVAAWAVNQLPRRRPELVDELLESGEALRSAQRAALSGSGRAALREATAGRRAAVAKLLDEATAALEGAGRGAGPHVDAIRSTLEAASTDEETGLAVRAGRLAKEVEPPSGFGDISPFELLAGGRAAPETKRAAKPGKAAKAEPSRAELRLRERLEARVSKAEDALAAARRAAAEARREADAAAKEADRLERELVTARRRAERADKAASTALAKAEESERALEKAQADLDEES
jgi:hypothetical protein